MAKIDKIKVGSTTYSILDSATAQIVCDNEESGNTASRTYTKGEYVKINDKLYKVTANIATGQAMTVGVNITETNVGDELSQLKSDLDDLGIYVYASQTVTGTTPIDLSAYSGRMGIAFMAIDGNNLLRVSIPFVVGIDVVLNARMLNDVYGDINYSINVNSNRSVAIRSVTRSGEDSTATTALFVYIF